MPNIREAFLPLCHLHSPRIQWCWRRGKCNAVGDKLGVDRVKFRARRDPAAGNKVTLGGKRRHHCHRDSPTDFYIERDWGSWLFEMVTGKMKLGNARQKQSEPDRLRVSWSLLIGRWSPLITEHNTLPGYTSRTQLGEMFLSSIRISLKNTFCLLLVTGTSLLVALSDCQIQIKNMKIVKQSSV